MSSDEPPLPPEDVEVDDEDLDSYSERVAMTLMEIERLLESLTGSTEVQMMLIDALEEMVDNDDFTGLYQVLLRHWERTDPDRAAREWTSDDGVPMRPAVVTDRPDPDNVVRLPPRREMGSDDA